MTGFENVLKGIGDDQMRKECVLALSTLNAKGATDHELSVRLDKSSKTVTFLIEKGLILESPEEEGTFCLSVEGAVLVQSFEDLVAKVLGLSNSQ